MTLCIKSLEQYGFIHKIKQKKKSSGKPPTTYDLIYDSDILRELSMKYPTLISDLQKNERIVSLVADQQNIFFKHPPNSLELNDAKSMLSLSRSFFNNYLIKPSFLDTFCELWYEAFHEQMEEDNITLDYKAGTKYERVMSNGEKLICSMPTSPISDILTDAFQYSIITDRINGDYNTKSLDFLKKRPISGNVKCYPEKPNLISRSEILEEFRDLSYFISPSFRS